MITVARALRIIAGETKPLGTERVPLAQAAGRVLAEDVVADSDMPPFDRSQMDGYAVRARDTENGPIRLMIVGESAAGRGWPGTLKTGEAVRIMTGAPVPKGADAVQKVELTKETGGIVSIHEPTTKGRYIVRRGTEVKKGKTVLRTGERLSVNSIAVPAAFGYAKLDVAKRPRVSILSTGTEIVDINKKPKPDQIRNSNSVMLASLALASGAEVTVLPIAGDDISDLQYRISNAVGNSDLLVTTGGVSVGKYDLTKAALGELGAEIFFDRVRLKPGKPTVFARLKRTLVFGLPGNPVSSAVAFYFFVRKTILLMQSAKQSDLQHGTAILSEPMKGTKGRESYLPVRLDSDANAWLIATPLRWHGSSDFIGFSQAQALAVIPAGESRKPGDTVSLLML
jgi:molybdenum cofactor synthesis domain-containing protein